MQIRVKGVALPFKILILGIMEAPVLVSWVLPLKSTTNWVAWTTDIYYLTVLEARVWNQGSVGRAVSSENCQETCPGLSPGCWRFTDNLWHFSSVSALPWSLPYLHVALLLCVWLCPEFPSFCKDTGHIGLGSPQWSHFNLTATVKILSSNKVTCCGTWS